MCLTLWRKSVFLIFILYNWFVKKKLFKKIQIFLRICPFSNIVLIYEIVILLTEKRISLWIPTKCFKTTERHSLAVWGSLCGEKHFLLIFIPFYRFVQKSCLNKSKFSSGITSFKHSLKNKLSEYFSSRFLDRLFYD